METTFQRLTLLDGVATIREPCMASKSWSAKFEHGTGGGVVLRHRSWVPDLLVEIQSDTCATLNLFWLGIVDALMKSWEWWREVRAVDQG